MGADKYIKDFYYIRHHEKLLIFNPWRAAFVLAVMAVMVILNRGTDCIIKARGRAISHAVDVAEILINKFFPTAKYKDIKISTEVLTNDEGRSSNVSSMEIVIAPK